MADTAPTSETPTPAPTPVPAPTPAPASPPPFGPAFVDLVSQLLSGELSQETGTVKLSIDPVNDVLSFSITQKIKFTTTGGQISIAAAQ